MHLLFNSFFIASETAEVLPWIFRQVWHRMAIDTNVMLYPPRETYLRKVQPFNCTGCRQAWKHSDFLCHNYVLNGLVDSLYNVYYKITTAKELLELLERKYKTEDAGTKKFVVARFLDYKMVNSKNVITQVQYLPILKAKGNAKKKNVKKGKGPWLSTLPSKAGIVKQKFQGTC
ncbi:hypothetical protein Tco_0690036 [Tanacetum coccineum]